MVVALGTFYGSITTYSVPLEGGVNSSTGGVMARPYEVVYIFDSALEEPEVNERLDRFHALLKNSEHPEPITSLHNWGKRTMAYPIKNKEMGNYVVAQFETDPEVLDEFERAIKLDEGVLRYLLVINEGLAPVPVSVGAIPPVVEDDEDDEPLDEDEPTKEREEKE